VPAPPPSPTAFRRGGYLPLRHRYFEPQELVDVALASPTKPEKGTFSYSNANYVLAGMIAQKVAGRPIGELITKRIIEPLGLRDTYWPGQGDERITGAHPQGYHKDVPEAEWTDVTVQEPSLAWAAGALIGTPSDLNRFLVALTQGRLLKPAQQKEMRKTAAAPGFDQRGGATYGLGIGTFTLSCGGFASSHGGNAPGFTTVDAVTTRGRAVTIATTSLPTSLEQVEELETALDSALCR
jgi:D-alanyl-D-alanine carboxypeptidase